MRVDKVFFERISFLVKYYIQIVHLNHIFLPRFTRFHIMLWQVFQLLISFSVSHFCLSKEWNQVFQATTFSSFSCFCQQWNQLWKKKCIYIYINLYRQIDASIYLVGRLVGWLVGQLVGSLVGRSVGRDGGKWERGRMGGW